VLTVLIGCQHAERLGGPQLLVSGSQENEPKLKGPQVADVQIALGRSLEKGGATEQAVLAYLEALKHDPSRSDACARLAVLYDQQGRFGESGDMYRKALAAQPANPDLYNDQGYSLYLRGDWAKAEDNLRHALALAPGHRRAHNNLGLVLAHTGQEEEALGQFREAGCSAAEAHNNLAFVLTLERRWDEARQHYQYALRGEPSSEQAKKGLRQLDALVTQIEPAAWRPSHGAESARPVVDADRGPGLVSWTTSSAAPSIPPEDNQSTHP
jgi:Tfp pilus assembly protein PilF